MSLACLPTLDKMCSMDKPLPPTRSRSSLPIFVLTVAVATFFLVRHGSDWLRRALIYLSQAAWARRLVSSWGVAWRVASRFVAGIDRDAAVAATRALNERGILVTLDYLGESCTHEGEALQAREEIPVSYTHLAGLSPAGGQTCADSRASTRKMRDSSAGGGQSQAAENSDTLSACLLYTSRCV